MSVWMNITGFMAVSYTHLLDAGKTAAAFFGKKQGGPEGAVHMHPHMVFPADPADFMEGIDAAGVGGPGGGNDREGEKSVL